MPQSIAGEKKIISNIPLSEISLVIKKLFPFFIQLYFKNELILISLSEESLTID